MTLLQADNEAEGDGGGDPALEVETKRLCFFSPNWSPIVRRQCSLPSGYPSQERKRRQTDLQVLQNQKSHLGILHSRRVTQESPVVLPNKPQMYRDPKIKLFLNVFQGFCLKKSCYIKKWCVRGWCTNLFTNSFNIIFNCSSLTQRQEPPTDAAESIYDVKSFQELLMLHLVSISGCVEMRWESSLIPNKHEEHG